MVAAAVRGHTTMQLHPSPSLQVFTVSLWGLVDWGNHLWEAWVLQMTRAQDKTLSSCPNHLELFFCGSEVEERVHHGQKDFHLEPFLGMVDVVEVASGHLHAPTPAPQAWLPTWGPMALVSMEVMVQEVCPALVEVVEALGLLGTMPHPMEGMEGMPLPSTLMEH